MSSRHRMASLTCGTRSRMTSTSRADHAIRQRVAQADPLPHASGKRRGRPMGAGADAECAPGVTPATPAEGGPWSSSDHARRTARRATEKRQLIFAVGQSVPYPAAGVRHQGECIHDSSRAQLHLRSASGGRRALRPAVLASARQWSAYGQGSAPSPDGLRGSEGCPQAIPKWTLSLRTQTLSFLFQS